MTESWDGNYREQANELPDADKANIRTSNKRSGIIRALADLPERAILDESAMARVFRVTPRTIRRMVTRYEIPPPIPLAGKSVWFAGRVLDYIESSAQHAEKEASKNLVKIRSMRG